MRSMSIRSGNCWNGNAVWNAHGGGRMSELAETLTEWPPPDTVVIPEGQGLELRGRDDDGDGAVTRSQVEGVVSILTHEAVGFEVDYEEEGERLVVRGPLTVSERETLVNLGDRSLMPYREVDLKPAGTM